MGILSGLGKAVTNISNSKFAMGALATGAFLTGVANKAAPAARDAAFDMAFDNPDADVAFTGRKIDTRFLLGTATGGMLGGAMKLSSPGDFAAFSGAGPRSALAGAVGTGSAVAAPAIGSAIGGGVLGGIVGAKKGGLKGALAGAAMGAIGGGAVIGGIAGAASVGGIGVSAVATPALGAVGAGAGAIAGGSMGLKKGGIKGAIAGSLIGGISGGAIGGTVGALPAGLSIGGAAIATNRYMDDNSQFFNESPYSKSNTSLSTARSLNASGDIVLGMHNSRRGY